MMLTFSPPSPVKVGTRPPRILGISGAVMIAVAMTMRNMRSTKNVMIFSMTA